MFIFGSDPEFMLFEHDQVQSAIGVVPGDRKHRHIIGQHKVFCDNVLVECEIKPGNSKKEVLENFQDCLAHTIRLVRPYRLMARAVAEYPKDQLKSRYAQEAGCKKEMCAYSATDKVPPNNFYKKTSKRYAGGHIHIGSEKLSKKKNVFDKWDHFHRNIRPLVFMLDLFVGIPSVILDGDKTSKERKQLYGQAGRFRHPDHGLEYRTPSNFWLSSPQLVELMYDLCNFSVNFVQKRKYKRYWTVDEEKLDSNPTVAWHCYGYDLMALRKAIDTHDMKMAKNFMLILEEELPYPLLEKIESLVGNNFNLYEEWGFA